MKRWAPLVVGIAACGADDRYLAPPPLEDARSAIVVVHGDERQVLAVDLEAGAWHVDVDTTEDARVDVLLYTCLLEGLQLTSGRIGLDADGPALPDTDRVFTAALGEGGGWTPLAEPPPRVSDVRLAVTGGDPCSDVDVEIVTLEGVFGEPRTLESFDADSVFLGLRDGRFFRVSRDGGVTPVWEEQRGAAPYVEVKRLGPERYAFVTSEEGCLGFASDLETITPGACLPRIDTSSIGTYVHTDGRITADGRERFDVLLESGEMFEVVDGVATNVSIPERAVVAKKGAILRVADDEALYAGPVEHGVVRRVAQDTEIERAVIPFFDKVVTITRSTVFGAAVLTNTGVILTHDTSLDEWSPLGGTGALQPLFLVDVAPSLFVVTAGEGLVIEMLDSGEACDTVYVGGDDARAITEVGDDGFAVAFRPRDEPVDVHFVRPRFAARVCQ